MDLQQVCPSRPANPYRPDSSYQIPAPTPQNSIPSAFRVNYLNFDSRNIAFEATGANINVNVATSLLKAQHLQSLQFTTNVGVVALELATSILNDQTALTGLFVMRYQGEQININGSRDCFIAHLTYQNSTAATANPTNRTNSLSFGATTAAKFQSGDKISVYACSANAATVKVACTLAVYIVPLVG